ncbi:hypothetical protein JKP88DRAFT_266680 [Tribonema minus]|uniref:Uncharacterized protein n=1 Tax=Tribonema minus TaxID=303371 RepID=A0A835ZFC7_9STRA|nr:hypothetical protein JKP88DRAFT_266680 [Tribonema minus]
MMTAATGLARRRLRLRCNRHVHDAARMRARLSLAPLDPALFASTPLLVDPLRPPCAGPPEPPPLPPPPCDEPAAALGPRKRSPRCRSGAETAAVTAAAAATAPLSMVVAVAAMGFCGACGGGGGSGERGCGWNEARRCCCVCCGCGDGEGDDSMTLESSSSLTTVSGDGGSCGDDGFFTSEITAPQPDRSAPLVRTAHPDLIAMLNQSEPLSRIAALAALTCGGETICAFASAGAGPPPLPPSTDGNCGRLPAHPAAAVAGMEVLAKTLCILTRRCARASCAAADGGVRCGACRGVCSGGGGCDQGGGG